MKLSVYKNVVKTTTKEASIRFSLHFWQKLNLRVRLLGLIVSLADRTASSLPQKTIQICNAQPATPTNHCALF